MASQTHNACADCGTRGNVSRDSDGTPRCHHCSYAAWLARQRPTATPDLAAEVADALTPRSLQ